MGSKSNFQVKDDKMEDWEKLSGNKKTFFFFLLSYSEPDRGWIQVWLNAGMSWINALLSNGGDNTFVQLHSEVLLKIVARKMQSLF